MVCDPVILCVSPVRPSRDGLGTINKRTEKCEKGEDDGKGNSDSWNVEGVRKNQKILEQETDNKAGSREDMVTKTVAEGFTRVISERRSQMLTLTMWFVTIFGTWFILNKFLDMVIEKYF